MVERIRKALPLDHRVFADTSTLYFEDKSVPVDPQFDRFWDSYAGDFGLALSIPHAVRGELLYQQTMKALRRLDRANKGIEDVSKITGKTYSHRVTEGRVRREVAQRLDTWLRARRTNVLDTPIASISWASLVEDSLWRKPPFSDEGKAEKGFRDAVILETICHSCENDPTDHPLVFLCKDELLRSSVQERLKHDERFVAYEFIEDFRNYLALTREKKEAEFITRILKRAAAKFYKKGDDTCVYVAERVIERIQDQYKDHIDNPTKSEKEQYTTSILFQNHDPWQPARSATYWITRPQFVSVDNGNVYTWSSTVTYVQQFTRQSTNSSPLQSVFTDPEPAYGQSIEERALVLPFQVQWSATVWNDGRFTKCQFQNISLAGNDFRSPTTEDRGRWHLVEVE